MVISCFYALSIWLVLGDPIAGFERGDHGSFARTSSNGFFVVVRVSTDASRQGRLIHHMRRHALLSIEVVIPSACHGEGYFGAIHGKQVVEETPGRKERANKGGPLDLMVDCHEERDT